MNKCTHVESQSRRSKEGRAFEQESINDLGDILQEIELDDQFSVKPWQKSFEWQLPGGVRKWKKKPDGAIIFDRTGETVVVLGAKKSFREREIQDMFLALAILSSRQYPNAIWIERYGQESRRSRTITTANRVARHNEEFNGLLNGGCFYSSMVPSTRISAVQKIKSHLIQFLEAFKRADVDPA